MLCRTNAVGTCDTERPAQRWLYGYKGPPHAEALGSAPWHEAPEELQYADGLALLGVDAEQRGAYDIMQRDDKPHFIVEFQAREGFVEGGSAHGSNGCDIDDEITGLHVMPKLSAKALAFVRSIL